ncbi:MAG: NrpR regulatory domain-containing protein [ANME-2 cluster archaeon]|nr:NrpR regulatory domain-containing protein [ANME-2 cluster archaeon]MDF1531123.1 NrpR regulatory domain-containing protein [ANME-2 cluster archaeon]
MISSNTDPQVQRKLTEILRIINESDSAIGARIIADKMRERGYKIGERGVRYHLRILDERGLTSREGYSGRVITEDGIRELEDGLIGHRIGFVITTIDELVNNTDIDVNTGEGNVIVNTAFVDKDDFDEAIDIIAALCNSPYSISPYVRILEEDSQDIKIPVDKVGIATVCSITIDGILAHSGIPVNTKYGGLVQVRDTRPVRFSDLILYNGTTIDPMKIFINKRMTSVMQTLDTGSGKLLANLREIPVSARDYAIEVLEKARGIDISGVIEIGQPGASVLGGPINTGKIGISLYAGVNSLVAVDESGIDISIHPISTITNFKDMIRL